MTRLIDADEAVKIAERSFDMWNMAMATADTKQEINLIFKRQELCKAVKLVVEHCPTVDPVKHSRWIELCCPNTYACLECGYERERLPHNKTNYCPRCGAKMDGDSE